MMIEYLEKLQDMPELKPRAHSHKQQATLYNNNLNVIRDVLVDIIQLLRKEEVLNAKTEPSNSDTEDGEISGEDKRPEPSDDECVNEHDEGETDSPGNEGEGEPAEVVPPVDEGPVDETDSPGNEGEGEPAEVHIPPPAPTRKRRKNKKSKKG